MSTSSHVNLTGRAPRRARCAVVGRVRQQSLLTRVGVGLFLFIVMLGVLAPVISTGQPDQQNLAHTLSDPSWSHPLGTDQLGRDVWTRLLYAIRTDVTIGVAAVILPFLLGNLLGLIAGYTGGVIDAVISRLIDVVVAFPLYALLLALVFVLGPGARSLIIAFTLVSWVTYARLMRARVLVLRELDYVVAARLGGLSHWTVMRTHVLPNAVTQSLVYSMSDIVLNILAIVTLGYLGLGIPAPTPEWGTMISDAQPFITTHWWLIVAPGLAVVFTGLSLSLIGDGVTKDWRVE